MRKSKTNISVADNTGARRTVDLILGDAAGHASGDILDANAVEKKINDIIGIAPEDLDTIAEAAEAIVGMQEEIDDIENSVNSVQEKVGNESVAPYKPDATYVDLGLTSGNLWATCNLGASSPEEAGKYYQWGDTQGYTADQVGSGEGQKEFSADFSDYKFGTPENMSKYNETDGLTELEAVDDAATAELGAPWKIPSVDDWQELVDECTWTWKQVNGINGYEVVGTNGNKIFIPVGGVAQGEVQDKNIEILCWTRVLDDSYFLAARFVNLNVNNKSVGNSIERLYGCAIRPIATSTPPSQSITDVLNKHTEDLNALTNPAIVQTYQLARYDLPDGVYAFGDYGDWDENRLIQGSFVKIETTDEGRYVRPAMLQPIINGVVLGASIHGVLGPDGTLYLDTNTPNASGDMVEMFKDIAHSSFESVVAAHGEPVAPIILQDIIANYNPIIIHDPHELKVDYFFKSNLSDFPSFNGYLAISFGEYEGQESNLYNWIFKVTQDIDHNVHIEIPGNATTLYSFSNNEITTRTVTPDVSSEAVSIVDDVFRQHYDQLVAGTQDAQIFTDFTNPFIDEVPDKVLWWIGA